MFLIKRDLRSINKQLEYIAACDGNTHLVTETFDKDIVNLCNAVNAVLDKRREAALRAERANAELKRAITNISHDLRTPLTSALGYVQLLKTSSLPQDKTTEYLNVTESRLQSLTALMNSLFEYTRIIEGAEPLNPKRINIYNALLDIISQFYEAFTAKGFNVSINIPDTPFFANIDVSAFTRAAQNLIRNALEHGEREFALTAQNGELTFANRVKNPEGIEAERIFERFYTADLSRTSGNTGLGLAIAKELIENSGGSIHAKINGDVLSVTIVFI